MTEIFNNIRYLMLPVLITIGIEFILIALYYFFIIENSRQIEKTSTYKETCSWCSLHRIYYFCVGVNYFWSWHFPLPADEPSAV